MGLGDGMPREEHQKKQAQLSKIAGNNFNATPHQEAGTQLAAGKHETRAQDTSHGGDMLSINEPSGSNKRRLTPMELKQHQRMKKEKRKRATVGSSQEATCPLAPSTIPARPSSSVGDSDFANNAGGRPHSLATTPAAEAAAAAAASPGRLGVGNGPLRRSASSPPSIGCPKESIKKPATLERHHTPPTTHPPGLVVEESLHPTLSPATGGTLERRPPGRSCGTNGFLDADEEILCTRLGSAVDDGRMCEADVDDVGTSSRVSPGRTVLEGSGDCSFRGEERLRSGDENGRAGVSLFDMVMSRSSCTASSSNYGDGSVKDGSVGGRSKLSAMAGATAAAERAAGGKMGAIKTSSLSSLLRGRRVSAGDERGPGDSMGGKHKKSSSEDWMALNLEKLSSFRVPETRMGCFPDGDREVLRRYATAPTSSGDPARTAIGDDGISQGGDIVATDSTRRPSPIPPLLHHRADRAASRRTGAATLGGHPEEQRWQMGSTDPLGRVARNRMLSATPPTLGAEKPPASARGGAEWAIENTLRTRVRFEMGPAMAIPPGIGSIPGHLENSALRSFAAGGTLDETLRRQHRPRFQPMSDFQVESSRCEVYSSGGGGGEEGNEQVGVITSRNKSFDRPGKEGVSSEEGFHGEGRQASAAEEGAETRNEMNMKPKRDEESAGAAAEATATAKLDEASEKWRRATLYWVHPATPLPSEALAAKKAAYTEIAKRPGQATKAEGALYPGGSAASGWNTFFWSRRRDWEQAFTSLYHGLLAGRREGACTDRARDWGGREGFYLQCPRFTVLWKLVRDRGPSGGGDSGGSSVRLIPAAAMTQSTRRLRKRLTAVGIEFRMPLDPAGDQRDAKADEDVLEEWKAMNVTGNAKPGAVYANEEDRDRPHISLLTFRGHMAVHGLFDFLLEACGSSAAGGAGSGVVTRGSGRGDGGGTRSGDVPLLLSREPFLNASLKALKMRRKGSMHRSRASKGSTEATNVQVLELVGHILPSALADLALAMASACTAFSDPCAESDSCGDGVASQPVNDSGDQGRRGKKETDRREESTSPTAETWHQGSGRSVGQFLGVSQKTADVKFPEDATRDEQWLFRVVGTVDGETKYLNAGLGAVEAGVAEKSVPADIVTGSYVLETRARFSSSRQGRWLVFDVCSTDPNVIPAVS